MPLRHPLPPSAPWFVLWILRLWMGFQTALGWVIQIPGLLGRSVTGLVGWAIDSGLRRLDSLQRWQHRQRDRRRRWWRKNGPLRPVDQFLGLWGIRPVQWRRWLRRSSLFLFTCFFTLLFTGILGWFLLPAQAAGVQLAIEPITWDFVGLDSNKPESQGPDTYVVGARVCNLSATEDAINVTTRFFKDGVDNGYTFIRLTGGDTYFFDRIPANTGTNSTDTLNYNFDNPDLDLSAVTSVTGEINSSTDPKTKYTINYTPSNCQDFYYNFKTSRTPAAWQTYQKYYIEADAANAIATVKTPRPRQIYIEQLISQARNTVYNFGCKGQFTTETAIANVNVVVGEVFTCTAQAQTATAYPQLSFTSDIPNVIFQVLNVQTSYSNPGANNSTVYADGCGWVQDPTDPRYHRSPSACVGETGGNGDIYEDQYPYPSTNGAVGNLVTTNYTIKVLALPVNTLNSDGQPITSNTIRVSNVILDYSGSSFHYNADYGTGLNLIDITVGTPAPTDLQVTKTHTGNFSYGPNSYTITVQNLDSAPAQAPVKITDTLPTGYSFTGLSGTDASKWSCGVSGQVVICTYNNGTPSDAADDNFPASTTNTLTFGVNVANTVPNGNTSTNVVTVAASNDSNTANNTATDPTTVLSGANLQLTKTDSNATFAVGDLGTYTLTVTNLGDQVATGPIKIIDTLPTGLTYASMSSSDPWNCVNSGQVVDCTLNQSLAVSPGAGSASSLTLTVNVGSSAVPSVTNTASASSNTYDPNPTNNTDIEEPTLVTPKIPDLSISKTHVGSFARYNPPNATANSRYTITVTNNGAAATTGPITVTDTLPASLGMSYQAHGSTTDWSCTNSTPATCVAGNTGTLTFTSAAPLLPGQSRTLTLDVRATTAGTANNTVTVSTPGDGTIGTKTSNDPTTVGDGTVDLAVSKTVTTAPTVPGSDIVYRIEVTNNSSGNGQDSGITFTDVVPANITLTSWSCTWDVDGPGGTVTDANDLGNGGTNVYNSCTNTGTSATDTAHNITNNSPASNTISIGTIALRKTGGAVLVTVNGTVNSNFLGTLTNTAQVTPSSGIDATPIDNLSTVSSSVNSPNLDLELVKTDADDPMTLGVTSSYTLTVTNRGSIATVNPITLVDALPSNFTFVSGASTGGSSGWVCANTDNTSTTTVTEITCVNNNILAAGASTSVRINVTPTTVTGSPVTNSATVSTPGEGGTTYPNTATQTTTILVPNVDLGIVKTASNTPFNIAHEEVYTLTVTNSGTTAAIAPITIADTLPTGMQFLYSNSSSGFTCTASGQTVTCNRYTNLNGGSATASVDLHILLGPTTNTTQNVTCDTDGTPGGTTGSFSTCNTATVSSASTETDAPSLPNNTAAIGVNINPASDLAITKTTVGTFVPGQTGTYSLRVTNNGPSNYTGSIVIDDAYTSGGSNVTFNSASTTTGTLTCPTAGSAPPFSCTLSGGLTAGQSATVTLTVNVTGGSGTTLANTASINNASLTSAGDPSDEDGDGTVDATQGGSDPDTNDQASASVTIASNTADLVLSKDDGDGESPDEPATAILQTNFVRGGTGTYILLVTNNGPAAATAPVVITEDTALPNGLTYAGYSATSNWQCTGTIGATTFSCTYGNWNFGNDTNGDGNPIGDSDDVFTQAAMPAGTTSGVEVKVNVPTTATLGDAVNQAKVTSANNSTGDTATETTVIKAPADLSVTKTIGTLTAGGTGTYAITVANSSAAGIGSADPDIYLTDYLPTGLTYTGFSSDGTWSFLSYNSGSNEVTFRRSTAIDPGGSSTLSLNINVAANAPATVRNFVRVEGFTEEVDNPTTAVCDREFTTQPVKNCFAVSTPVTNGISPTIVKKHPSTDNAGAIDPVDIAGDFNTSFPYTIVVANPTSPATDLTNILVYDTLPETLTYVSASISPSTVTDPFGSGTGTLNRPCSYDDPTRTVSCNLITLKSTETASAPVTITLNVRPTVSGVLNNTARLSTGLEDSEAVQIINPPATGAISGTVFADNNSNGGYDSSGDTPTANITVRLYRDADNDGTIDPEDALLASTVSAANGTYSFATTLTGNFLVAVDTTDADLPASPTFTTATVLDVTLGSSDTGNDFGYAGSGAVSLDFGDAPNSYGTVTASGGPRHTISSALYLGASAPDAEADGQASTGATGDDAVGDDEDSVTPGNLSTQATSYTLNFALANTTGSNATLWGWIDFDRNGTFEADEAVSTTVANSATTAALTWATGAPTGFADLASTTAGTTFGRFRLTSDAGITANTPGGAASNGEVEDYPITVTTPVAGTPNLRLVKRITALLDGSGLTNYTTYVDDGTANNADNDPDWPGYNAGTGSNTYTVGVTGAEASPGDTVEYTVYFLNAGDGVANNVKICDALSAFLTYIPNSYDPAYNAAIPNHDGGGTTNLGLELNTGGSSVYLTGLVDAPDRGAFVPAGTVPANCVKPDGTAMTVATDNPNGTVTVEVGSVDPATGSGTPSTAYGYVRFRATVK